jgi:hypothetical protein
MPLSRGASKNARYRYQSGKFHRASFSVARQVRRSHCGYLQWLARGISRRVVRLPVFSCTCEGCLALSGLLSPVRSRVAFRTRIFRRLSRVNGNTLFSNLIYNYKYYAYLWHILYQVSHNSQHTNEHIMVSACCQYPVSFYAHIRYMYACTRYHLHMDVWASLKLSSPTLMPTHPLSSCAAYCTLSILMYLVLTYRMAHKQALLKRRPDPASARG